MNRIIQVNSISDIPKQYQGNPIGHLLEYQNLNKPFDVFQNAELLVGMCMDNRKHLTIPENFAYIIRSGGANLRHSEFKVSYAIGVGGIKHIALISHNNCGMANLFVRKDLFINGLVENAGWDKQTAEEHFNQFAPLFEIGNEIDFVTREAVRLRQRYPNVMVAPLHYNVDSNHISVIEEK